MDYLAEILAAATGLIGAIAAAWVKIQKNKTDKELTQAHNELSHRAEAISFERFMHEWADIQQEVIRLFDETCIDRFLMLRAWNGTLSPKWTTAFLQLRAGPQAPYVYMNVELDNDYISRLKKAINDRWTILKNDTISGPSLIKDVYEAEGVKSAIWFHIADYAFDNDDSKAIMYCSFATHEDTEIDSSVVTRAHMIAFRLRALAQSNTSHAI